MPPLTAVEAVTFGDIAEIATEVTGRRIRRIVVDDEAWVQRMVGAGMPEASARLLLGMSEAARRGDFAATDPTLGDLLGRKPQTVRTLLESLHDAR